MALTMETIALVVAHKAAIDAVNAALPVMLTEEEKAERIAAKEAEVATLADAVKDFVEATADTSAEEAGAILRIGLELVGRPAGTCKNYGRAVQGFRKLRDAEPDTWRTKTVKDAQQIMRSATQVQIDTAKAELAPYIKAAKLDQLNAVLAYAKEIGIALPVKGEKAGKGKPVADNASHGQQVARAA